MAVARRGDAPIAQVAKDFGISESCLRNWLHHADVEDGHRPGVTRAESEEVSDLRRRNRLLRAGERGPAPRRGVPVPSEPEAGPGYSVMNASMAGRQGRALRPEPVEVALRVRLQQPSLGDRALKVFGVF